MYRFNQHVKLTGNQKTGEFIIKLPTEADINVYNTTSKEIKKKLYVSGLEGATLNKANAESELREGI